mmetsp:Transcript_2240/g.5195  ORF Transcript_2240/g.5195 Transcript_2240/m.5195 type:complete len:688 (-) Transcript_2240:209-2272(-)
MLQAQPGSVQLHPRLPHDLQPQRHVLPPHSRVSSHLQVDHRVVQPSRSTSPTKTSRQKLPQHLPPETILVPCLELLHRQHYNSPLQPIFGIDLHLPEAHLHLLPHLLSPRKLLHLPDKSPPERPARPPHQHDQQGRVHLLGCFLPPYQQPPPQLPLPPARVQRPCHLHHLFLHLLLLPPHLHEVALHPDEVPAEHLDVLLRCLELLLHGLQPLRLLLQQHESAPQLLVHPLPLAVRGRQRLHLVFHRLHLLLNTPLLLLEDLNELHLHTLHRQQRLDLPLVRRQLALHPPARPLALQQLCAELQPNVLLRLLYALEVLPRLLGIFLRLSGLQASPPPPERVFHVHHPPLPRKVFLHPPQLSPPLRTVAPHPQQLSAPPPHPPLCHPLQDPPQPLRILRVICPQLELPSRHVVKHHPLQDRRPLPLRLPPRDLRLLRCLCQPQRGPLDDLVQVLRLLPRLLQVTLRLFQLPPLPIELQLQLLNLPLRLFHLLLRPCDLRFQRRAEGRPPTIVVPRLPQRLCQLLPASLHLLLQRIYHHLLILHFLQHSPKPLIRLVVYNAPLALLPAGRGCALIMSLQLEQHRAAQERILVLALKLCRPHPSYVSTHQHPDLSSETPEALPLPKLFREHNMHPAESGYIPISHEHPILPVLLLPLPLLHELETHLQQLLLVFRLLPSPLFRRHDVVLL